MLDLWVIKKWRPQEAYGDLVIVRYADDYVVGFEHRDDAERFLRDLKERFRRFELELNADKTRLIEFGRNAERNRRARGERRPETFDFLGFTHYCRKDRKGRFGLGRKPVRKRVTRTMKRIKIELRRRMHDDVMDTGRWLGRVVRGWLNYYAVPASFPYLQQFVWRLRRIWIRVLRRRSQKDRSSWTWLLAISNKLWPKLRIVHPWPTTRFAVNHRRIGAVCVNAHVRIRAGGAGQPVSLPRSLRPHSLVLGTYYDPFINVWPIIIVTALVATALSIAVGVVAHDRYRRNGVGWFLLAMLVTPVLALLFLLAVAPHCRASSRTKYSVVTSGPKSCQAIDLVSEAG